MPRHFCFGRDFGLVTLAVGNGDPYRTLNKPRATYQISCPPDTMAEILRNPDLIRPGRVRRDNRPYIDCAWARAAVLRGDFVVYSEL